MKKILSLLLLCVLCRAANGEDTDPIDPIFTAVVGGVWSATLTGLYAKPEYSEKAEFKWNSDKTLILAHLIVFKDKKVQSTEDDTQWWDGKQKKMFVKGTDSEGNFKEGTSRRDGEKAVSEIIFTKKDGSIIKMHGEVRFFGANKMEIEVSFFDKNEKLKKQKLHFERTP